MVYIATGRLSYWHACYKKVRSPEAPQLLPQYNDRANAPKLRIIMHTLDHIEGTTDALAAQ